LYFTVTGWPELPLVVLVITGSGGTLEVRCAFARRWTRDPRPFDRSGVTFCGRNACVLRKRADDTRPWDHHRSF